MKKYGIINIILSTLFVITIISCKPKGGNTNKIKSIRLTTYFIDHKSSEIREGSLFTDETYEYDSSFNLVKDRFDTYKYDFDKHGYKIKKYSYNGLGGIFQTDVYKNDSAGNPIEILDYDYKMKDIEHKTLLKYSLTGNLITQSVYDHSDSLIETYNYEYDRNNMEIKRSFRKYDFFALKYSYTYDNKDRIIEKTVYEKNSRQIDSKVLYDYDYAGNKIKETTYTLDESENLTIDGRKLFKYDTANRLIEETHIRSEKKYLTTYEYNEDGKLNKEIFSEGVILYSYDMNNKITKTCIGENKTQRWKEEEFYDNNGNKIQSIHYDESNRINNRYFYKYNEKNQPVLDSCIDLDGTLSFLNKIIYINDTFRYKKSVSSHWILSSEQNFPAVEAGDGRFEYITYQTLDKLGNVIMELIDYVLLQELEFDYKQFDSNGNWTRRVIKEFGKPYRIETREIKYY